MAERRPVVRALAWAMQHSPRLGGPIRLTIRVARAASRHRVGGHAAEMAFFALLSMVPMFVATGAALGYVERFVDPRQVARGAVLLLDGMELVFSTEFTEAVLAPLVHGVLFPSPRRGGLALSGLLVAFGLASRVFDSAIRGLDLAYGTPERRSVLLRRLTAFGLAVGSVVAVVGTLTIMVVGPLFGTGRELAARLGLGTAFEVGWRLGRLPLLFVLLVGFLACVYRFGPMVRTPWGRCLPGAVVGVVLWVLVSFGLRVYFELGGAGLRGLDPEDEALEALTGTLGGVMAVLLWIYLSSAVILLGGELNARLSATRR